MNTEDSYHFEVSRKEFKDACIQYLVTYYSYLLSRGLRIFRRRRNGQLRSLYLYLFWFSLILSNSEKFRMSALFGDVRKKKEKAVGRLEVGCQTSA